MEPRDMDALILCGGLGTRLQSVVNDRPKPMARVDGVPFLEYLIQQYQNAGFRRFILCAGYRAEVIRRYFESVEHGIEVVISQEPHPLGTAGAVRYAASRLDSETCVVANGDSYCPVDLRAFLGFHQTLQAAMSMVAIPTEDASAYGSIVMDEDHRILAFHEKRPVRPSWISAGIYCFDRQLIDRIPDGCRVSLENESFPQWIAQGIRCFAYTTTCTLLDIGTPERYALAQSVMRNDSV